MKEHVEKRAAKKGTKQHFEVEQLINFSSKLVKELYFDIDTSSFDVPIAIPTKARSKCMMKCKQKELVEEGLSLAKVTWKQAFAKRKEITKVLQWI